MDAQIAESIVTEMKEITSIADEIYTEMVGDYFNEVERLSKRFQSMQNPITDAELEEILTVIPLKLFKVAESLSKVKLTNEIVKIRAKDKNDDKSLDYKLAASVYASVIVRIEKEASYSRELIMASKKIWESRRSAENAAGIRTDITPDLPDYIAEDNK